MTLAEAREVARAVRLWADGDEADIDIGVEEMADAFDTLVAAVDSNVGGQE